MALKHVMLGLLAYKASSGYSLHKMFFKPTRPMLSQIYRALNDMYDEKLVDFKRVEQKKLPARNVFHLTKAGRAELDGFLKKPWAVGAMREQFIIILWFSRLVRETDIIKNVKVYRDTRKEELEYYHSNARERVQKSWKGYGTPLDRFYWDLAFDYVQRRGQAELEWAEATIKKIANRKLKGVATKVDAKGRRRGATKGKGKKGTNKEQTA